MILLSFFFDTQPMHHACPTRQAGHCWDDRLGPQWPSVLILIIIFQSNVLVDILLDRFQNIHTHTLTKKRPWSLCENSIQKNYLCWLMLRHQTKFFNLLAICLFGCGCHMLGPSNSGASFCTYLLDRSSTTGLYVVANQLAPHSLSDTFLAFGKFKLQRASKQSLPYGTPSSRECF